MMYCMFWKCCFHFMFGMNVADHIIVEIKLKGDTHDSVSTLLKSIKDEIPWSIHNGWKLQKFHDLLHVSHYMYQFGTNPHNWDASPGEHNLIDFAEWPA